MFRRTRLGPRCAARGCDELRHARVPFSQLITESAARREAIGAFTCYNLEQATGVLRAAEARDAGVVILVSEKSFAGADGPRLLSALVAVAERSEASACVQLDHASDLGLIESAFSFGAGAVLADGSHRRLGRAGAEAEAAGRALVPPGGRRLQSALRACRLGSVHGRPAGVGSTRGGPVNLA